MSPERIFEPWRSFLVELDSVLDQQVILVCLGGFAVTLHYGLDRPTGDIDLCDVIPNAAIKAVLGLAGKGSDLHHRHGVYLQMVRVPQLPDGYEERLIAAFPHAFKRLRFLVLEAHDLALSKIERNSDRDLDDVKHLARAVPLDLNILANRYKEELRPYLGRPEREDLTMTLWIDAIRQDRASGN